MLTASERLLNKSCRACFVAVATFVYLVRHIAGLTSQASPSLIPTSATSLRFLPDFLFNMAHDGSHDVAMQGTDDAHFADSFNRNSMGHDAVDADGNRLGPDGEPAPRTEEEYAAAQLTLRAIVSSKEAGVIIGKAGKNVAELRDETGVKAGVSKVVQGVHDRVLTVTGALKGVADAYAIVAKGLLEGAPQVGMGGVVSNSGTHRK